MAALSGLPRDVCGHVLSFLDAASLASAEAACQELHDAARGSGSRSGGAWAPLL